MRTFSLITFCFLLCATSAAQNTKDQTSYDPPAYAMIDDSLGHALGLTNDQMKLVQTADENYRKSSKAGDANSLDKREHDLKAVLLPTQYTQWKEVMRKRKGDPQ